MGYSTFFPLHISLFATLLHDQVVITPWFIIILLSSQPSVHSVPLVFPAVKIPVESLVNSEVSRFFFGKQWTAMLLKTSDLQRDLFLTPKWRGSPDITLKVTFTHSFQLTVVFLNSNALLQLSKFTWSILGNSFKSRMPGSAVH